MLIKKLAAEFKSVIFAITVSMTFVPGWALGGNPFHMEKDPQGLVRPFKVIAIPLSDFIQEYARITSTTINSGSSLAEDIKGTVTLLLRHPLKQEELTEIFHRVIGDNGYAVVDAPAGNGFIIVRARDARDLAVPVYEIASAPDSSRMVTAYRDLKYVDAETVARNLRSFMPANSRIIPTSRSQILITDTASNIRRLNWIILKMDTEESVKRERDSTSANASRPRRSCGEQQIEKLVVTNLEVQNEITNQNSRPSSQQTSPSKPQTKSGVKQ